MDTAPTELMFNWSH